ncbi:MAG TPA: hypothetical protein VJS69_11075 [Candidatus Krumholzibacteria bacterium]|nr:hypothetical protein [Candidatus Krumholzibacteria bacterium]
MKKEVDFTDGKRTRGKTRLSIWIDNGIVKWFTAQTGSRRSQEAMMNDALRWHIESLDRRAPRRKPVKKRKK